MGLRLENRLDDETEILISKIIGVAIEVHKELGAGFLEKVYETAMSLEMSRQGIAHTIQTPIEINYKGVKIHSHILDILVEGKIILELKSVATILPIHEAQIISYLKSTGLRAGLLINFKENLVKNGIKRFIWKP
jgi:GxxExxY protein